MKKIFYLSLFLLIAQMALAQVKDPVSWKFEVRKKGNGLYEFTATATVQKPWHIYSQKTGKGPVATQFKFNTNPLVAVQGETKERGKLEKVFDNNFNSEVLFYSGKATFTQVFKLKVATKTNISGKVEYMVCNDEQCLPPVKKAFDVQVLP